MLIGYVSDEHFVAIADAQVQFEAEGSLAAVVRSTTSGALYAALRCPEVTMTTAEFALELDNLRTFGPLSDTAQRDLGQAIATQWEERHVAPIVVPLGELFVRVEAP